MYSKTKGLDENICENYRKKGLPIVTLRLSNVYGPYQQWRGDTNFVPYVLSEGITKKAIEIKNGSAMRDWIYVGDVAKAIYAVLKSEFLGTLNVGTGKGKSSLEVAQLAGKLTGATVVDLKAETHNLDIVCDITKIKSSLKWEPKIKLEDGMLKAYNYYKRVLGEKQM